jgi:two-component system sensor histidine kinase VicK
MYIALVSIVMIVSGTFMLLQFKNNEINKTRTQLKEYADTINGEVVGAATTADDMRKTLEIWRLPQGTQGFILDAFRQNQTLAPEEFLEFQFSDSSIIKALGGAPGFNSSKKDVDFNNTVKEWITYATLTTDGKYLIYMRMDANTMNRNLGQTTVTILITLLIALALTGVLGLLLAGTLTKPIISLTRMAKEMAEGKLDQEIPVASSDEIGQLTDTINYMASELSNTISTLAGEKNKMEAVLNNMTDGVLAYDINDNLIHANGASEDLLNLGTLNVIPARTVMNHLGFSEGGTQQEMTIPTGDRFIASSLTPYKDLNGETAGIVVVIRDVTKMTKLDNMRKEFVANVSHELRTPLTTVKTYTETLLDGALEDHDVSRDFLKVIDSEAERMSLLVQDLLELSRLDNRQLQLQLEIIDLNGLVTRSIRQNSILAEKKGQKIIFVPVEGGCFIEADAGRVNQVLTNILSNSVKYSPEGSCIEVIIEEDQNFYRMYIKDNGIGIPPDDLRRVFERFYRVDKARSRAMGGTGLGLAIAKEIMEAHGFRITANSELNKGTTMILRFDKLR